MTKFSYHLFLSVVISIVLGLFLSPAFAETYSVPTENTQLIGEMQIVSAHFNDSLVAIGQQYDVGFNQITIANPKINPYVGLSMGTSVHIPSRFLLPPLPHRGIC